MVSASPKASTIYIANREPVIFGIKFMPTISNFPQVNLKKKYYNFVNDHKMLSCYSHDSGPFFSVNKISEFLVAKLIKCPYRHTLLLVLSKGIYIYIHLTPITIVIFF
jgi:hypothetical protein